VKLESWAWNGKFGSESNLPKADPSPNSFLFQLKNPHIFLFSFALNAEKKGQEIYRYSSALMLFGG
jgi:hypothetical protein